MSDGKENKAKTDLDLSDYDVVPSTRHHLAASEPTHFQMSPKLPYCQGNKIMRLQSAD